jgi:uncharacterized membrane protein
MLLYGQDDETAPNDESIGEILSRLKESGQQYARAEFNRQKVRATEIGLEFRNIAVLLGIAAFLVLAAAVALLVGVIVALTIGAWGATGLVVGVVLAVAFLLVILARNRFRGLNGEERS